MTKGKNENSQISLRYEGNEVFLESGEQSMSADFSKMGKRLTHANLTHELIVKAAKIKDFDHVPLVCDATAGLGEDSLLLAAAGCRVILYERDPMIAALLKNAIEKGASSDLSDIREAVSRMEVREEDSITALPKLFEEGITPDIVFLDPMFPEREKSSLVKKKFQLIHLLEKPCSDEDELLNSAVLAAPAKIIIKRPVKAAILGSIKPDYSLTGKTVRYDIILLKNLRRS